jgi:23S rRNA (uracil1939-C5)-methyltransferase
MGYMDVTISSIGAGGFGVGILPGGKVVFVPRTAPGDRARIRLVKEKSRWARGELLECLEDGPGRRLAACPMYPRCDGCSLQHLVYDEQLRWKSLLVGEPLRRMGKVDADDPEVVPSPREFHYRNRVTFTLRRLPGGRIVAGLRELGHRGRVLDLGSQCLLPEDPIRGVWEGLRKEWGAAAHRLPGGRQIRLTLQNGVDGVSLLVRGGRGMGEPAALLDRVDGLSSVWHEERGVASRLLAGESAVRIGWGEEILELDGGGFVQVNTGLGRALYDHVLGEIGEVEGRRIIDAYCGPGVLGRSLARQGAEVTGIDVSAPGRLAPGMAVPSGFKQVVGRVERVLKRLLPADIVVLNPPRTGLDASIPAALEGKPVEKAVYVSCDPATLARDLKRMGSGYRVTRVRSFDLFPQTGHVETVVTLRRVEEDIP